MAKHKVDDNSPELFPELYLKPRRLDYYARQLEQNMIVNKEIIKKINLIQRTGVCRCYTLFNAIMQYHHTTNCDILKLVFIV